MHGGREKERERAPQITYLALLACSGGHSMFCQNVYVTPSSSTCVPGHRKKNAF